MSVLITGAQPKTIGITVNGLPPSVNARIVPSAPTAPSDPAPMLQRMPLVFHEPVSPSGTSRASGTSTAIRK